MKVYSHSKLSTFEQCPQKYKFRYVDNIVVIGKSIESFLGKIVHEVLEWIYLEAKQGRVPSLDEVILYYSQTWVQTYDENEIIMNGDSTKENHRDKGVKFLIDYYMKHHPFDDNTLEVEKEITLTIDEKGEYQIRGFIDRLSYNLKTCEYEIHDYKTSNTIPSQEKIDEDRQLALYSIAIKEMFGKDKEVLLVWHYLAYNKNVHSKRTNEQLEELKRSILDLIHTIESTKNFHPYISRLCDWCEYQRLCPFFRHRFEKEEGDPAPRMTETVDEWIALKRRGRETYRRIDELAGLINAFCEEHGYRRLFGSDGAAIDRRAQHVTAPDEQRLRQILEPLGLWDVVVSVDTGKLNDLIESRTLPPDVEDAVLASREEIRTQYALHLKEGERARR